MGGRVVMKHLSRGLKRCTVACYRHKKEVPSPNGSNWRTEQKFFIEFFLRPPITSLKQAGLGRRVGNPEVLVSELGGDAAAGGAFEKADLEEIGFVDVFDGVNFLA